MKIDAEDTPLRKLFGGEYFFKIPDFQRPFSWESENFEELIVDLLDAFRDNVNEYGEPCDDTKEDYDPYFLGSIILEGSEDKLGIVDGQQRIVSLSILVGILRDLIGGEKKLQKRIYQPRDEYAGIDSQARVEVRDFEEDFYHDYIVDTDGTEHIDEVNVSDLSESEEKMLEAVKIFRENLNGMATGELKNFAKYLIQKVVMVEIVTESVSSAFRLFNITNARGLPLTNADLLKSHNLGTINEQDRGDYAEKWEDIVNKVGNDELENLISYIRHIKIKDKARKSIYDEYKDKIFEKNPQFRGKDFIDYLQNIYTIYREKILDGDITTGKAREEIYYYNLLSVMKSFLPSDEWEVALIKFIKEYDPNFNHDSQLYEFLKKLERKVTVDWIRGLTRTQRFSQIYSLIKKMEGTSTPKEVLNSPILNKKITSQENKEDFKDTLDAENFYRKGRYRMAKYVLLRLCVRRYDNSNRKTSYEGDITTEHILPQDPTKTYWLKRFNETFRREWTDKLGNLVLLSGSKNYSASNKPYPKKVNDYFEKKSDFLVTNELDKYNQWNPNNLKERHNDLIKEAVKLWFS